MKRVRKYRLHQSARRRSRQDRRRRMRRISQKKADDDRRWRQKVDQKRRRERGRETKGKGDTKGGGKDIKGHKCKTAAQTEDSDSVYTSQTAQGKNWGLAKEQEKWEREQYHNSNNWSWYPPEHRWVRSNRRKGRDDQADEPRASEHQSDDRKCANGRGRRAYVPRGDEGGLLNFGIYRDWAYGEILMYKPNYAPYIAESRPAQQQFQEWATPKAYENEGQS